METVGTFLDIASEVLAVFMICLFALMGMLLSVLGFGFRLHPFFEKHGMRSGSFLIAGLALVASSLTAFGLYWYWWRDSDRSGFAVLLLILVAAAPLKLLDKAIGGLTLPTDMDGP